MNAWLRSALHVLASVAVVCAVLAIEFRFHGLESTTVDYSLLLTILYFAVRWDRLETIVASLVAALGFLYYFQPPVGTFKADDPQSYVEVLAFLITALVVSQTALTARKRATEALERKCETERLYELSQAMLASDSLQATAWVATNQINRIFEASGAAFFLRASGEFQRAGESLAITDDDLRAVAANLVARTAPEKHLAILPVDLGEEVAGS